MRNKNTKTTYFLYSPYECSAVEEYLEMMAENGWLLTSIKKPFFKFKRIEPKKIKFSVDVLSRISNFDPKDSNDALDYREYCEAAGWKYICQDKKVQVFCTEDYNSTIEIHTDQEEKFKSVFKAALVDMSAQIFLMLMLSFNIYMSLSTGNLDYGLSSNFMIGTTVLIVSFIVINIIRVSSFFIWAIRAKKKLKENSFMPYNNYRQLKIKNRVTNIYMIIYLMIFLALLLFDENGSKKSNIMFLVLFAIMIIISIFIKKFIDKKRYSRDTNITITIGSTFIYLYLTFMIIGVAITASLNEPNQNEVAVSSINLRFIDFGYKENNNDNLYTDYEDSILAKRIHYSYSEDGNSLSYTTLQSQYPWVLKIHEKRLIEWLGGFLEDLKEEKTNLPSNIKVYSDAKKEAYIFVSEDKVVDMQKRFKDISEEEFLNTVYEKLLDE